MEIGESGISKQVGYFQTVMSSTKEIKQENIIKSEQMVRGLAGTRGRSL